MAWFLYVVECSDKSLYTGITTDIARRVKEHNSKKGAFYTKNKSPVKLVYQEVMANRSEATRRERVIKSLTRKEKLSLIGVPGVTLPQGRFDRFIKRAKESGAKDAKVISARAIVVAEWVRMKCQFGCSGYGQSLTCPPYSPAPEVTRRVLACYKHGLLVRGDEYTDIHALIPKLEREIFLAGYFKAFGMGAGPCQLCEKCAKSCRNPDKTRPSMEACGIDVYSTVRSNGYPIKVLDTQDCKGDYYGLVLIE